MQWASACGNHDGSLASFCVAMFDSGQTSSSGTAVSALVHGLQGPRQQSATVEVFGENPPRLKPLPSSFRNDLAATKAESKTLSLPRSFSHETLFQEAERGPHFLPSLLLGLPESSPCKPVLPSHTDPKSLASNPFSESEASGLLAFSLPTGAFISRHHAGDRPQWVPRPPGASSGDYLAAAKGFAAASAGRVVYRSSTSTPLGVVTSQSLDSSAPPRWYLSGASPFWTEDDVLSWASGRGFKTSPTSSATATQLGFSLHVPLLTFRLARANALLPFKAASLCL